MLSCIFTFQVTVYHHEQHFCVPPNEHSKELNFVLINLYVTKLSLLDQKLYDFPGYSEFPIVYCFLIHRALSSTNYIKKCHVLNPNSHRNWIKSKSYYFHLSGLEKTYSKRLFELIIK